MIELEKDGNIYVVTMNNDQNMICPTWQDRMLEILDIMENDHGAGTAMVLAILRSDCDGARPAARSAANPVSRQDGRDW